MLISPTPHGPPPSATVLLTALSAVGVCAYYDRENRAILAHAADVPRAEALNHVHVMLGWIAFPSKQPDADRACVTATIRRPDGTPQSHHQAGALYRTARLRPIADEAQAAACAVAAWMTGRSAGLMLLSALAEYGITPGDGLSIGPDRFDIPLPFTHGFWGRLSIADRFYSVRHAPEAHTGWHMFLHDERGEPVGDPVFVTGAGGLVDCAEDSAVLAAAVADWLTSPVSRHCDCYGNERPGRPHDRECNRYRLPVQGRPT
ncbi:hypothetical protein [Streptomyces sp. SGAir0957]